MIYGVKTTRGYILVETGCLIETPVLTATQEHHVLCSSVTSGVYTQSTSYYHSLQGLCNVQHCLCTPGSLLMWIAGLFPLHTLAQNCPLCQINGSLKPLLFYTKIMVLKQFFFYCWCNNSKIEKKKKKKSVPLLIVVFWHMWYNFNIWNWNYK